jgi:hypothetical protein
MEKVKLFRFLFFSLLLVQISFVFCYGTTTFADALRGYEVVQQFLLGGSLNTLTYPSVTGDFSFFVSWWSPAQWLFPLGLYKLGITDWQLIQNVLITSFLTLGLYGYYKLFNTLKFSIGIVWFSMLCIVSNQLFYWHVFMYYGGDLFVFAGLPFFILMTLKLKEKLLLYSNYHLFIYTVCFVICCLFGFLFKSVWLIFVLAALFYIVYSSNLNMDNKHVLYRTLLVTFVSGLIVLLCAYFLFIQYGETPGSSLRTGEYNQLKHDLIGDLTYAIGSPIGVFTRFSPMLQKVASFFQFNLNYLQLLPFIGMIVFFLKYKVLNKEYTRFLVVFGGAVLFFFTLLFLTNRAVSYEMRHFAPLSFLFFPAFLEWILNFKQKKTAILIIGLLCGFDSLFFGIQTYRIETSHSFFGELKLLNEEVEMLQLIREWDDNTSNGILISDDNYWLPLIGVRRNDKWSGKLNREESTFNVYSGIELNKQTVLPLSELKLDSYASLLLIEPKTDSIERIPPFKDAILIKRMEKGRLNYLFY